MCLNKICMYFLPESDIYIVQGYTQIQEKGVDETKQAYSNPVLEKIEQTFIHPNQNLKEVCFIWRGQ